MSALQKAIRRSKPHALAVRLHRMGFKRLKVIASEDVGLAHPGIAAVGR